MRRSSTGIYSLGMLWGMLLIAAGVASAAPAPAPHLGPRAGCVAQAISCGQTVNGTLSTTDCSETLSGKTYYEDLYQFNAPTGTQIAVSESSTAIFPLVFLLDPTSNNVAQDDNSGVASSQVAFSVTAGHGGTYTIGASSFNDRETGNYNLTLVCGTAAATTCVPDANTLCLNNNRFRVTATYRTATLNGNAMAVKLTDDTGYLWFFNSANVETVLKVINGCAVGGHYWFFAGGLTNVFVQMTVTDTTTGFTRVYTNPLNQPFEPIQDTSAFPNCP
jgi:hypothetical protein